MSAVIYTRLPAWSVPVTTTVACYSLAHQNVGDLCTEYFTSYDLGHILQRGISGPIMCHHHAFDEHCMLYIDSWELGLEEHAFELGRRIGGYLVPRPHMVL
jgi:hypothetical protein